MMKAAERINQLFEELVPASGKAESLAGEIARAVVRLGYRFYNDGDQIGIDYGNETCNAAARFLLEKLPREIAYTVCDMWGLYSEDLYEEKLNRLFVDAAEYIDSNPELMKMETEDMFDYYDKIEDEAYLNEDEDDEWYEEDEY